MTEPVPTGYSGTVIRFTVDKVGDSVLLGLSDDRGDRHDLLLPAGDAEALARALHVKARTEGHDAVDDLLDRLTRY